MRTGWVLLLALAAPACDSPTPPPVAGHQAYLDADDLAVMKGLLDSVIRPERLASVSADSRSRTVEPHFLVVDTTLAVCPQERMTRVMPLGGCIGPDWLAFVSQVLPTALLAFESRNVQRLPIGGSLGSGVSLISATVTDFVEATALLQQHPPGSAVVSFGAPVYPAAGTAVVAYRLRHSRAVIAAARLQRQADGRWALAADGMRGGIEGTAN